MAKAVTATKKKSDAKSIKKPLATNAKASPVAKKMSAVASKSAGKKVTAIAKKKTPAKSAEKVLPKKTVKKSTAKAGSKKGDRTPGRYKCRLCGYIYSPHRGEPHNGIPAGTAFEDLPDDYVCPICGYQGKGKIGKWGFEEWRPTRYLCSICSYVYDEKRGEPHRGIKPGTKFEDLPDDYVCPICALDPKIRVQFGKVLKQGFEPINF